LVRLRRRERKRIGVFNSRWFFYF